MAAVEYPFASLYEDVEPPRRPAEVMDRVYDIDAELRYLTRAARPGPPPRDERTQRLRDERHQLLASAGLLAGWSAPEHLRRVQAATAHRATDPDRWLTLVRSAHRWSGLAHHEIAAAAGLLNARHLHEILRRHPEGGGPGTRYWTLPDDTEPAPAGPVDR